MLNLKKKPTKVQYLFNIGIVAKLYSLSPSLSRGLHKSSLFTSPD